MFYAKFGNRWLLIPDQKLRLGDAVRVVLCPTVLCAPNQETQEAHPTAKGCFVQVSDEPPQIAPMSLLWNFIRCTGDTFVWQKTKGLLRPALLAPLPSVVQRMNLFALFCLAKTEGVLGTAPTAEGVRHGLRQELDLLAHSCGGTEQCFISEGDGGMERPS